MDRIEPAAIIELIEARQRDEVTALVRDIAATEGLDAAVAVLAEVQYEVGARWHCQRWTVADEHAASAIVDLALTAAAEATGVASDAPRIVVACVEDEWHVLPARMLDEQLRARGWPTLFLGSSAPADDLGRFVSQSAPLAVALSCSMDRNLPGARRSIQACHAAGVPVVVGGAAFASQGRADAVGADAATGSIDSVHRLLQDWAAEPPAHAEPTVPTPPTLQGTARDRVLDAASRSIVERIHPLATARRHELARLRDDVDGLLRAAEAAAHTGDGSIVTDHLAWMGALSESRGEPVGLTAVVLEALAAAAPDWLDLGGERPVQV